MSYSFPMDMEGEGGAGDRAPSGVVEDAEPERLYGDQNTGMPEGGDSAAQVGAGKGSCRGKDYRRASIKDPDDSHDLVCGNLAGAAVIGTQEFGKDAPSLGDRHRYNKGLDKPAMEKKDYRAKATADMDDGGKGLYREHPFPLQTAGIGDFPGFPVKGK